MRYFKLFILLQILTSSVYGQHKHLSIGIDNYGLCIGNSYSYNGLRLNVWDNKVENINGINISGYTSTRKTNGLAIGILAAFDSTINGLQFGGGGALTNNLNGFCLSPGFVFSGKLNGLAISGIASFIDTTNGVQIGLWGTSPFEWMGSKVINGVAVGGLTIGSNKINGLAISLVINAADTINGVSISCFNIAKELTGFQFGILNYVATNRKIFRLLPIINFNFRKKKNNR
jgi:hypothetical protein